MERAPVDEAICSRCLTHFGYDDFAMSHEELRAEWIKANPGFTDQFAPPREAAEWLKARGTADADRSVTLGVHDGGTADADRLARVFDTSDAHH